MSIDIGDIGGEIIDFGGEFGDRIGERIGEINFDLILDFIVELILERGGELVEQGELDRIIDIQITGVASRHNLAPSSKELQKLRRTVLERAKKRR